MQINPGNKFDVLVAGGGPSGAMAAIAAGRLGAKVLLIEQHGCLGGALTAMGVGPMMSFHNGAGEQIIRGLGQELVDRLIRRGKSPGHQKDNYCGTVTPFDSEALKIELDDMAAEAKVTVLFHTQLAEVATGNNAVDSVLVCNKAGLTRFRGRVYVDATGDGDLAAFAGAPFVMGRKKDSACQPMTMNLKVANVDTEKVRRYALFRPGDFSFSKGREAGVETIRKMRRLCLGGFFKAWEKAKASGEIDVPRENVLIFEANEPGVFIVNTSRVQGLNATDPGEISRAETIGRKQCEDIFRFLKRRCPGFEKAVRMDSPGHIGVRESRHIRGLYTLTQDDLVSERRFPDPVALGGYPIDIHSPDKSRTSHVMLRPGAIYQVPLKTLLVKKPGNLIIAGRSISATHEAAAAIRVTPIMMAVGQAAGTLAALAVESGKKPSEVPYPDLKKALIRGKALL